MSFKSALTNTVANTVANTARKFCASETGSIAVPFAIGLSVLLGASGYAIDLALHVKGKEAVQDVADAASLAAALSTDADQGELDAIASDVFAAHFGESGRDFVAGVSRDGDRVTVQAQASVPTTFSRLFGINTMDVNVASTSVYSERKLDISLVLDTTDSMSFDGKIDDLKVAAGNLIDTIERLDGEKVRVSVTPFAQHVNVGTSRRNSEWLSVPADRVRPSEYTCNTTRPVIARTNCRFEPRTTTRDGVRTTFQKKVCDVTRGEPVTNCAWRAPRAETWNGCVGSRQSPLDLKAAYDGARIPGLLNKPCGSEIQTLTSDMNAVRNTVNSLSTRGETYLPSGLLWGWRQLDRSAPLTVAAPASAGDRILVLMTDGENTKSKLPGQDAHRGNSKADADARTAQLCDAVKASEVTIYTIAFQVDDGATRNLLQDCASSSSNFFRARNAQELVAAFDAIGDSLKGLRVAS